MSGSLLYMDDFLGNFKLARKKARLIGWKMWKTVAWNFLDAFLPRDFVGNYYTWVFCEGQFKNNNKKFIAFN